MTRSSSSDSSALSNIVVGGTQQTHDEDATSEAAAPSTPPTSPDDSGSASLAASKVVPEAMEIDEEAHAAGGCRPKRARSSVSTYNLQKLSSAQVSDERAAGSRSVSGLTGRTLVNEDEGDEDLYAGMRSKIGKDIEMDWDTGAAEVVSPQRSSSRGLKRQPSVKDRVKKAAGKVGSVLGKRSRQVVEAGKRKLGISEEESAPQQKKVLKELETGTKGLLDEMDLSDDEWDLPPPRPAKRAKLDKSAIPDSKQSIPTAPPLKITSGKRTKKWQKEGLYVGQNANNDPSKQNSKRKLQKKPPPGSFASDAPDTTDSSPFMTLPLFSYSDKTRDFTIPFDIFAPTLRKGDEKPKDWHKINRNRLVGEAKEFWEKAEKLPTSICVCSAPPGEQGCGDDCLNRVMQYECNDDNCNLPALSCSNRAFAELASRMKKGGVYDVGVEVIKTPNRGFGVRSCRVFAPGQIVMEYTGEIISEGECQRRMRDEYKDKQCYYLMELERGLIIDGTKGSMARFINHSCEPNCEVRMVKVNGTPRMAVFAGDEGVMTGEELTYDYNFDNFGAAKQLCYCGAPNCRGTLSKRLNATELKKLAKEDEEKKRKASLEAQKHAQAEAKKKDVEKERGSGWRGWVAVDDPETKERLRREKREKEEAEKNSVRAKRLAARRETLPASSKSMEELTVSKTAKAKRRITVQDLQGTNDGELAATVPDVLANVEMEGESTPVVTTTKKMTHIRSVSTSSKFTEEFSPALSRAHPRAKVMKQTSHVRSSSRTTEIRQESLTIDSGENATTLAERDELEAAGLLDPMPLLEKSSLERTKSKGKEVLKSVGQAVKNGLLGLDKDKAKEGDGEVKRGGMRQSRLSFAKLG